MIRRKKCSWGSRSFSNASRQAVSTLTTTSPSRPGVRSANSPSAWGKEMTLVGRSLPRYCRLSWWMSGSSVMTRESSVSGLHPESSKTR